MWRICLQISIFIAAPAFLNADPSPMSGAGRIEYTDSAGTCSAALVAPDIVVTAAHCAQYAETVRFRPGGKVGHASYAVARVLRHPLYDPENDPTLWKFRFDFAVLLLEKPVPENFATPFVMGSDAKLGEDLFLVSWKGTPLPRQRKCRVQPGVVGLVTLGCPVEGGESGAPVLRQTEAGLELVAVISSRTVQGNQPVAMASNVRLRLPPLIRAMH